MKTSLCLYPPLLFSLCLFLLTAPDAAYGRGRLGDRPLKDFILTGELSPQVRENKWVEVQVYPWYFNRRSHQDALIYQEPLEKGHFLIRVPSPASRFYIALFFHSDSTLTGFLPMHRTTHSSHLLLVSAGDSVSVQVEPGGYTFRGRGGASLTCQYRILCTPQANFHGKQVVINPLDSMDQKRVDLNFREMDSTLDRKLRILKSYKKQVAPIIYRQLKLDYAAEKIYSFLESLYFNLMFCEQEDAIWKALGRTFYQVEKRWPLPTEEEEVLLRSRIYTDLVCFQQNIRARVENVHDRPSFNEADFGKRLAYFHKHDSGKLLEKLLLTCFIDYKGAENGSASFLTDFQPSVKEPYFQKLVRELQQGDPGRPAYSFALPDSSGTFHRLEDFRGKVVVIDFWFTGCPSCVGLAKKMKEVHARFEKDTDIVFISVNVDEKRDQWIASLKKGIYTQKGDLHLFTEGQGCYHPLFLYYGYAGCPQLMIIDRAGKIFTTHAVRPGPQYQLHIMELIERALQKRKVTG